MGLVTLLSIFTYSGCLTQGIDFAGGRALRVSDVAARGDAARRASVRLVIQGLDADTLTEDDLTYAQKHLNIISGLYGLLRPLDLIQPYRLEMGSRLSTRRGKNLYAFWGSRPTEVCNEVTASHENRTVVCLASGEYIRAIQPQRLAGPFVTCHFKEIREGVPRTIGFVAKKARGTMARYMVRSRVEDEDGLKEFGEDGYAFEPGLSSDEDLVFVRDRP